jgi:hypothetical protein
MQAESQAQDATSLAKETRAEADRLRKEFEDAEMKAATAASRQTIQPSASNGYSLPSYSTPSYGQHDSKQPHPSMQNNAPWNPIVMGDGGVEIPALPNPHVMGSGSMEIPTPANNDHDYGNPFG